MRPGTPGFVGSRLREAREARGLSGVVLAELVGVTRQALSQYENGNATPHPDVMGRLCGKLNLPTRFFWSAQGEPEGGAIIYRSMSTATKGQRTRAERRLRWLVGTVSYVRGFVDLPAVNLPRLSIPADISMLSQETIEGAALECRRHWGLGDGPISNVVWLVENNGVVVSRFELDADKLDAFSVWSTIDHTPYVVLNAGIESAVRCRYDVAHELGHLILHRHVSVTRVNKLSDHRVMEDQAHYFAGAFLLPPGSFSEDFYLPTLDSIRALKSKWRVSIGAMIKRAAHLNLMSQDQERRLWINYNRRGWRLGEPLDDVIEVELPRLMRSAVQMIIENRLQSQQMIVDSAPPYQASDIEVLAGLPPGYLSTPEQLPLSIASDRKVVDFPSSS